MTLIRKKKISDQRLNELFNKGLERGLEKGARIIALQAAINAPKKTGALAASIRVELATEGTEKIARIGVPKGLRYALYVHNGTLPHVIRVKNAKVLTNGSVFFGVQVSHPGTAPNPFLQSAFFDKRRLALLAIKQEIKNVARAGF